MMIKKKRKKKYSIIKKKEKKKYSIVSYVFVCFFVLLFFVLRASVLEEATEKNALFEVQQYA